MSADVNIPDPININTNANLGGNLDLNLDDLDLGLDNIRVLGLPKVELGLTELPEIVFNAAVKQLPDLNLNAALTKLPEIKLAAAIDKLPKVTVDAGLNNIRIKELAPINLQFSLKPFQLRLPAEHQIRLSLFGFELIKVRFTSERQVVLEDL